MPSSFSWTISVSAGSTTTTSSQSTSADTAIRDFALGSDGDLLLKDGDLVFNFGTEGITSDLLSRLKTFLGECFLDTSLGLAWREKILGHKPSAGELRDIFRTEILGTPGIKSLSKFDATTTNRVLQITFVALAATGDELEGALSLNLGGT